MAKDKSEKKDKLDKKMDKTPEKKSKLEDRPARSIRTHTGVTIPSVDPENKKLSKSEFIAKRVKQREKAKKMDVHSAKIDRGEA